MNTSATDRPSMMPISTWLFQSLTLPLSFFGATICYLVFEFLSGGAVQKLVAVGVPQTWLENPNDAKDREAAKLGLPDPIEELRRELENIRQENSQLRNEITRVGEKVVEDGKQLRKEVAAFKMEAEEKIQQFSNKVVDVRVLAAKMEVKIEEFKHRDMEEKTTLTEVADFILKNFEEIMDQVGVQQLSAKREELPTFV